MIILGFDARGVFAGAAAGSTALIVVTGATTAFLGFEAAAGAAGADAARSAAFFARPAAILAKNSSFVTGICIFVSDAFIIGFYRTLDPLEPTKKMPAEIRM